MQIKLITDKELDRYGKVTVVAGKDKKGKIEYVFDRRKIVLPRNSEELIYNIKIDSCKKGETLILLCSTGSNLLFAIESERPIESISAIKKK